jgi:ATP-dependent protease ClpP protease subunit
MPNWKEVLQEINEAHTKNLNSNPLDWVRRKYLKELSNYTHRNVIAFYSGFLQKPDARDGSISDKDVSGFMLNINKLDKSIGLDIILHTPGGGIAATEALVNYLRAIFGKDIRLLVPQIAMSAGTMIAFSGKEIVMGKHSSLGPIDPQMGGLPAEAVIGEFQRAKEEILNDPRAAGYWQFILSKYHPTFLTSCEQAIELSKILAKEWLLSNMCENDLITTDKILDLFTSHKETKMHSRHICKDKCKEAGLKIIDIEGDQTFQDLLLTVHHAFMHTFAATQTIKIIENHDGNAYIESIPAQSNFQNSPIKNEISIKSNS